ncbi:MAG: hypothetical protein JHC81_13775 [Brevundimonas sp.]|uniref:hypothetical protein n=1 Tax=Brevundimonas sp. TaxID=1871086 RepID=UPI001A355733|nr:hypothetical protein [Brevundimonas sp.]MBJ7448596.1 hypothetical protein [Brevundimonas sp.]
MLTTSALVWLAYNRVALDTPVRAQLASSIMPVAALAASICYSATIYRLAKDRPAFLIWACGLATHTGFVCLQAYGATDLGLWGYGFLALMMAKNLIPGLLIRSIANRRRASTLAVVIGS